MGCDIHAYVEYVAFKSHDDTDYWKCLISNAGSRDYTFFSLLADCGRGYHSPVIPNRGFPEGECSYVVREAYYLQVSDEFADHEGYVSIEQADSWVKSGLSQEVATSGSTRLVTHPDWHSVSWLTYEEFAQVIATWLTLAPDYMYDPEWDAMLVAMRTLEDRGHKTRLVFWFDN